MAKNPQFVLTLEEARSRVDALLDEILDLHDRKNANYAGEGEGVDPLGNFLLAEKLGVPAFKGVLVRLSDKWSRICNLARGVPDKVGESIRDTLIDQSVYSLIAVMLYDRARAEQAARQPVSFRDKLRAGVEHIKAFFRD